VLAGDGTGGFRVHRSVNLTEGMKKLSEESFDTVLLDLSLPEASGLSVLDRILAVTGATPVVALTEKTDDQLGLQAVEVGAQGFLIKNEDPVDPLIAAIQLAIERKRSEEQLRYLAQHDHLTGLVNRALFDDRLRHAVSRSARDDRLLGLVLLDIDAFAAVNLKHGTALGDLLLRSIGQRMRGRLRKVDTLGRLGSDEFAVVAEDIKTPDHMVLVATKLLDAVAQPFFLEGAEIKATASVGTALFPFHGNTADELLAQANGALAEAKAAGGNTIQAAQG
jgi:diguanylate cyclase (GGDEF)-like protein